MLVRRSHMGNTGGEDDIVRRLRDVARPLERDEDLDPLIERIGDARYVLLGEATHGTSEFYTWRTRLSDRLIRERGFSFIAVEGDWPDCYEVNRYVKALPGTPKSAYDVLHAFERWPTWMWGNREVVELCERLRRLNENRAQKAGFYGLDVYSLWSSLSSVVEYLDTVDGEAAKAARQAFRCFEPYGEDVHDYARATLYVPKSCERQVLDMLGKMVDRAEAYGQDDPEAWFNAEQNAIVVKNAEHYYRTMVRGDAESWNIRDHHMVETLERLMSHHGPNAKAIVWEHNTHIGDARATDMAREGMVNVGQLVRERHGDEGVVLVGFGSHRGSVIAAAAWDAPMTRMKVPEAAPGSYEDLFHIADSRNQLVLAEDVEDVEAFREPRGHRAIGVVYHPLRERFGNYVPTVLPERYDAFLYIDESHAVSPLRMHVRHDEVPETWPSGL